MLVEIIDKINSLHAKGVTVKKISFIGYSLGGLVARYIIGELQRLGVLDRIEPVFFCTFATPHLGVWFFKKRFQVLNVLGSNLLGFVGSELFIKDKKKILVQLASGDYFKGLSRFRERFCFANIRHDRTVNFYSSYITDRNPFDAHWNKLDLVFHKEKIPSYRIRDVPVSPKFVDFTKSKFADENSPKRSSSLWLKLRNCGIILLASIILPVWIPIVFTASTIASVVSYVIVKTHKKIDPESLKVSVGERLEEATGEALENAINIGQYDPETESARGAGSGAISTIEKMGDVVPLFKDQDTASTILGETDALPLNDDRKFIMQQLNSLSWSKFGVYVNVLNAHDGIVARKGLKKSTAKGIATIRFFAELVATL